MPVFVALDEAEQKRLEQALFIEIIHLAPAEADLIISTDSWPELPGILGQRTVVSEGMWVVALIPATREFLMQQALTANLQTMMVHFYIRVNGRDILTSYDRMSGMKMEPLFPGYSRLITEYAALGIIMT
ncbi:MAG TPA: hypothetical protein VF690_09260 [Hymenobacter sp.]